MALTIRTDKQEVRDLIDLTKDATNQNSSSKALLEAARIVVEDVPALKETIDRLRNDLEAEEDKNAEVVQLVKNKQNLLEEIKLLDKSLNAII